MEPQTRKRNKKQKNTGKSQQQQHPNGVKREAQPKAAKPKQDRLSPPKKSSGPSSPSTSRSSGVKTALCVLLFGLALGGGFCVWYMWNDGVGQLVEHWLAQYGFVGSKDVLRDTRENHDKVESEFEEKYNLKKKEQFNEKDESQKDTPGNEEEDDRITPVAAKIYENIVKSTLDDRSVEDEEYEASQDQFFKDIQNEQLMSESDETKINVEEALNHLNDELQADDDNQLNDRHKRDAKEPSVSFVAEEKYSRETRSSSSQAVRKPDKEQVDEESVSSKSNQEESDIKSKNYDSEEWVVDETPEEGSLSKEAIAAQILEGIQKDSSKSGNSLENEKSHLKASVAGEILDEIEKSFQSEKIEDQSNSPETERLDLKASIASEILEEMKKNSQPESEKSDKKFVAEQILDEIQKKPVEKSEAYDISGIQSENTETDNEDDMSDFNFDPNDDIVAFASDDRSEIPIKMTLKDVKLQKYEEVKKAKEDNVVKLDEKIQAKDVVNDISKTKEEVAGDESRKVKENELKPNVIKKEKNLAGENKQDQDVKENDQPLKTSEDKLGRNNKVESSREEKLGSGKAEPKQDKAISKEKEVGKKEKMMQKEKTSEDATKEKMKDEGKANEVKENKKSEDSKKETDDNLQGKKLKEDKLERMKAYIHHSITNELDYEIRKELDFADKLLNIEKFDEALKKYDALVSKHPQSPRALYGKALSYNGLAEQQKSNQYLELCITNLENVLDLPDVPDTIFRQAGDLLIDRSRFRGFLPRALKYQKKLVAKFSQDLDLKNQLAVTYLLLGREEAAKNILDKVLEADPTNGFAKVHLGFILKTRFKDVENGIRLMEEGIATKEPGTNSGRFYYHLGDGLQRLNKTKEAYKVYEEGAKNGHFPSAYQRSLYNVDSLTAHPWWTPEQTGYQKFLKLLEDNWKTIRDEGIAQINESIGLFLPESEDLSRSGEWKEYSLYSQGRKLPSGCTKTPKTCKLIDQIPDAAQCKRGQVKFSIMQPGTSVWPHTGPTNCRLRTHLGLVVPPGSHIRVANETRTWQEGKILIFDDSFEHEVWHEGTKYRLILIVDFWHPELTSYQKQTLTPI